MDYHAAARISRRRARQALIDAVHLIKAQGSEVRVDLLHSLGEMAARQVGGTGMQLAQAAIVHQSIVAHSAHNDRREYCGGFLVLLHLAEQLAQQYREISTRLVRLR